MRQWSSFTTETIYKYSHRILLGLICYRYITKQLFLLHLSNQAEQKAGQWRQTDPDGGNENETKGKCWKEKLY